VVSYFLRYFSSTSTEQISPDSAGRFTSFDPVGFAIFATLFDAGQATPGGATASSSGGQTTYANAPEDLTEPHR
jgi:hypothetical protein